MSPVSSRSAWKTGTASARIWLSCATVGASYVACSQPPSPPALEERPGVEQPEKGGASGESTTHTTTLAPEALGANVPDEPTSHREAAPAAAPQDGPRVYGKTRFVWIRSAPTTEVQWIGYLWTGGSVRLRDEAPVAGRGCSKSWYPVEPYGWVCVDDQRATLNADDPIVRAVAPYRERLNTAWPHRYAAVNRPIRRHALLPGPEPQPLPELPRGAQEGRTKMRDRSTFAYHDEVQRGDVTYLLAADLSWVAKHDVEPYEQVTFRGLALQGDIQLPLAFFRGEDRPGYRLTAEGTFEATDTLFPRLSWVKLTGARERVGDHTYYETVRDGLWVRQGGAVIPTPKTHTPWGAPVGEPDTTGLAPQGRATWIEVSVLEGWLVAFEGTRPVYVTLVSAGRGGIPHSGRDPLETASTPIGAFSITGKFATATMESPVKIVHSDVPWTQNFSGPHALHGAYWHDNWGNLMSAGCINVSPEDGRWLYEFSEPPVPEGWHGVRHLSRYGPATRLLVHE